MRQDELPMKDVTPKKKPKKAATPPLTEGKVAKGARNHGPSQIASRPKPPAPINPKTAGTVALRDPEQPKSVLQIIAEAASNPAINPENMRALLDMQKEIVADERRMAYDAAFIELQAELPVINKDGRIEIRQKDSHGERTGKLQQATPYATFENIMDAIQPLLTKYKFGLWFKTESAGDRLLVRAHLTGYGHERTSDFPLPAETSGSKNNVQGWGSSEKYGMRYTTVALLNIRSRALQDADTDGFPGDFKRAKGGALAEAAPEPETLTDKQARDLRDMIDEFGVPVDKFCQYFGIGKVSDLPRELLPNAQKECCDYRDRQEAVKRHG